MLTRASIIEHRRYWVMLRPKARRASSGLVGIDTYPRLVTIEDDLGRDVAQDSSEPITFLVTLARHGMWVDCAVRTFRLRSRVPAKSIVGFAADSGLPRFSGILFGPVWLAGMFATRLACGVNSRALTDEESGKPKISRKGRNSARHFRPFVLKALITANSCIRADSRRLLANLCSMST